MAKKIILTASEARIIAYRSVDATKEMKTVFYYIRKASEAKELSLKIPLLISPEGLESLRSKGYYATVDTLDKSTRVSWIRN